MDTYVMGIDLGLKGAFAVLDPRGKVSHLLTMPVCLDPSGKKKIDIVAIDEWFTKHQFTLNNVALIVMEQVHSFGNEMRSALFSFGKGTGRVEGYLDLRQFSYQTVTPQSWKAKILAGTKKDKQAAIGYVHAKYPTTKIGQNDGLADAICLAELARTYVLKGVI